MKEILPSKILAPLLQEDPRFVKDSNYQMTYTLNSLTVIGLMGKHLKDLLQGYPQLLDSNQGLSNYMLKRKVRYSKLTRDYQVDDPDNNIFKMLAQYIPYQDTLPLTRDIFRRKPFVALASFVSLEQMYLRHFIKSQTLPVTPYFVNDDIGHTELAIRIVNMWPVTSQYLKDYVRMRTQNPQLHHIVHREGLKLS